MKAFSPGGRSSEMAFFRPSLAVCRSVHRSNLNLLCFFSCEYTQCRNGSGSSRAPCESSSHTASALSSTLAMTILGARRQQLVVCSRAQTSTSVVHGCMSSAHFNCPSRPKKWNKHSFHKQNIKTESKKKGEKMSKPSSHHTRIKTKFEGIS